MALARVSGSPAGIWQQWLVEQEVRGNDQVLGAGAYIAGPVGRIATDVHEASDVDSSYVFPYAQQTLRIVCGGSRRRQGEDHVLSIWWCSGRIKGWCYCCLP